MLQKFFDQKYSFPVVVLAFLFICYQLAIKNTLMAWQINRQFRTDLAASAGISAQPGYLVRKQKNLQGIVERYSADSNAFRSAVITGTALIANRRNIVVSTIPLQEPGLQTIRTAVERVNFTGGYFQLLQALRDMEDAKDLGLLRSVKFSLLRAPGQQTAKTLEMSVYLQVIKK
ncbi:hypothetical protein ACFQZI_14880 [Mucilaginibacter lutimaris]|uniref:General secretion pathway protein GspM n=1 Tax=Mucilaginibacter lutimaris TaxID=931629 RepID=A0ABW2ZJ46_9SPHI